MTKKMQNLTKQSGFTLLESIIVALIFIAVIAGALVGKALWDTRNDINAFSSTVQTVAETAKTTFGGAGYGTAALNFTLNSNRAFANPRYRVVTVGTASTITNAAAGAVVTTGATNNFTYSESGLVEGVCSGVVPRLQSPTWATVQIGAAAARAVPVTPQVAATDCAALAGGAIVLTSNG